MLYFLALGVLILFVAWLVYTTMQDNKQQIRSIRPSDLGKVLIRHVQYLLILCGIGLPWPASIVHMRNVMSWFFVGATTQVFSVDCVLQYAHSYVPLAVQNVLVRLATPAVVLLAVLLLRMVYRIARTCSCTVTSKGEMVVSSLVVLFLLFPLLVQTSLNMFACIHVDNPHSKAGPYPQYAVANASRGYWVWDVQQACWEGWHLSWGLGLGLPCFLLFCVLVPGAMFFVLHHKRAAMGEPEDNHVGFLYHCLTPERYYWEVVASLQTIILVVVSTFSFVVGPLHATILMQVCFAGILAMQYIFKPFAFVQVQRMQVASSMCLLLTATIGLTTFDGGTVAIPEAYKVVVGVLGLLVNLAFMCCCAWMTATVDKAVWTAWAKVAWEWCVGMVSQKRRVGRGRGV